MADPRPCQNCGAPLAGPYCHACGQRDEEKRVALWKVLAEAISEAFELDGRLPRTVGPLLARPGFLAREWTEGRRRRYTSPVRILVFALAVGFFGLQLAGHRAIDGLSAAVGDRPVALEGDELVLDLAPPGVDWDRRIGVGLGPEAERDEMGRRLAALAGRPTREVAKVLLDAWFDVLPLVVVLGLLPALTLLLELAFPRFLAIEHLLVSMHLHALGLLLTALVAAIGWAPLWGLLPLGFLGWLWVAVARLFPKPRWERALKVAAVAGAYGALFGICALGAFVAGLARL